MKKLLFSGLFLLVTSMSFAQLFSGTRFGASAGLNFSNLRNIHGDSNSRLGFHAGGLALIPVSNSEEFFIQTELAYSQKGEKNDTNLGSELYQLDYLDVPVLFKPYFSDNESEFYALVGPKFSFLLNDKVKDPTTAGAGYHDDKYKSFDLGIVAGIGFSFQRRYEIDLRYEYGMTDVVENDASNEEQNNTSNLHLSLSYIF